MLNSKALSILAKLNGEAAELSAAVDEEIAELEERVAGLRALQRLLGHAGLPRQDSRLYAPTIQARVAHEKPGTPNCDPDDPPAKKARRPETSEVSKINRELIASALLKYGALSSVEIKEKTGLHHMAVWHAVKEHPWFTAGGGNIVLTTVGRQAITDKAKAEG